MLSLFLIEPSSFVPLKVLLILFVIVILFPFELIALCGTLQRHFSCEEWCERIHP
jgi:hypothetical protein